MMPSFDLLVRHPDALAMRQEGFSLVELAIVMVVIGLIAAASGAYLNMTQSSNELATDAQLAKLSESVVEFARTRLRLPCPDTAGQGYEALSAGVCGTGVQVGWFPYLSMGLSQPADKQRAVYGVYRNGAAGADLAIQALPTQVTIAANQATSSSYIFITGDGSNLNGAQNCSSNMVSNPAFVILSPGDDRDGDGVQVDGIHSPLPGSGRCFASPTQGISNTFDDRVMAVSAYALLARLTP
jgi:prepilin-type N-terminal cleavage/methylation domain-containing protein